MGGGGGSDVDSPLLPAMATWFGIGLGGGGGGGGPAKHVSKGDQINMCLLYINHFLHFFFPEVKCHLSVWAPLLCSYKTMIKCVPVCMCVCDVCVRVLSACVWGECMCVCVCVCVCVPKFNSI